MRCCTFCRKPGREPSPFRREEEAASQAIVLGVKILRHGEITRHEIGLPKAWNTVVVYRGEYGVPPYINTAND
jgi:hypothetical protein